MTLPRSIELPDDPRAVRVLTDIAKVLCDTESDAHSSGLVTVTSGGMESRTPKGDADCLRTFERMVDKLEKVLGKRTSDKHAATGFRGDRQRLRQRLECRMHDAPADYAGAEKAAVSGKVSAGGRPPGADTANLEAKMRSLGLASDN